MRRFRYLLIAVAALCVGLVMRANTPIHVDTGTWVLAGQMTAVRAGAASVLLPDGRILITGGTDAAGNPVGTTEFFNADGTFTPGPAMAIARTGHAAMWLFNGEVVVTGGATDASGSVTNTAEIFDPISGDGWTTLPSVMLEARSGHTITPLQDGSALIAGGVDNSGTPVSALEVLQIAPTEHFTAAGALQKGRKNHAATALLDGRVLIVGGTDADGATLASTEVFDPATGLTSAGLALGTPRSAATGTTLLDGKVLIAGGSYPEGVTQTNPDGTTTQTGPAELASMEIYDPAVGTITTSTATMSSARSGHQAFLLPNNNNVLFVGGKYNGQELASADLYTPWSDRLAQTPMLSTAHYQATGSALNSATYPFSGTDGLLLIAGGNNRQGAELYGFATVKTDKGDYSPGEIVTITGNGWLPGETVAIRLHQLGTAKADVLLNGVADAEGRVINDQFALTTQDWKTQYVLTATGSHASAQNAFTDGNYQSVLTLSVPSSVSSGAALSFSAQGKCQRVNTPYCVSVDTPVPAGYTIDILRSTNSNCTSTTVVSSGSANSSGVYAGSFNAPVVASNTTYYFSAKHSGTQQINGDNWNQAESACIPVQVVADATAPTTTITLAPAPPNGTNSWYTSNVHVIVSAADNVGGTGVVETRCVLNPASAPANFDAIPAGCAYSGSGTDVTTEGQHVIYAASKDGAGNKETPANKSFKIDKTAPDTQITAQPASLTKETSANFSFTGTDNLTAPAGLTFQCSLDSTLDSAYAACSSPKNYPALTAGLHTFYVRAIDQAGNTDASPASFAWTIDNLPPQVTVQFTPPVHGINGWYNKDDTVSGTVTATDDSNVSSLTCVDGASTLSLTPSGIGTKTATASISLTGDGTHNISCTAVDAATNSATNSANVKIDTTLPALTLSFTPDTPDGSNGWWKTPGGVPYAWTCSDTGSGIDSSFNGGCPAALTGTVTLQGSTPFTLQVRDQAGNLSVPVNRTVKLDNVAPTITAQLDKTAASTGWFNISTGAPTVSFTCSDATSGLAANACPASHLFGEGADQTFSGTVTDEAGNSASAAVEHVNVDITAPTLALVFTPDSPDGTNGWWKTPGGVPYAWTCSDAGPSGIDGIFNGGCPTPLSGTITAQGATTLSLQVRDVAGNSSAAVNRTVKLDNIAPTITAQLDKTAASTSWFNISTGAPTVSFTCSDATSGLAANACPASHLFGEGADQTFSGTVTDEAGNSASAAVEHVNVDLTAPTLTLAFSPDTPDGLNGWWKTPGGVPYAWTCSDSGPSGIDNTFNGGCPTPLSGTITAQGATTLSLQVRDVAGNSSAAVNRTVMLDNIAPTITASLDKSPASTGWFNVSTGAPTANFTCSDATSGLAANACPASHLFGEGADQTFSGTVTDEAGNSASAAVEHVNVDLTAPTLTLLFSPDTPDGLNGWWKTSGGVPYAWACSDSGSGIDGTFNGGCPASLTGTVSAQGSTTFTRQVRDVAGNLSAAVNRTVMLDNVAPTITAALDKSPASTGWFNITTGAPTVSFTCSDATSGLAVNACPASHLFGEGADQTHSGTVTDEAGNSASAAVEHVNVDLTAPTLTLLFSPDTPDGLNGWWKTPGGVPYTWTCGDATSGIDTAFAACPTSGVDTTQGASNFTAQVRDKAGNPSTVVSRTVNLDNIEPVVSLYPPADSCSLPGTNGWCRGTQTAGFSAADATSGVTGPSPFSQSTATNGSAVLIASGSVCDAAGNCNAGISAGPYKIDSVAPTLTCGAAPTYTLSQPGAVISALLVDTLSGPLSPGMTISAPADTSNVGSGLTAPIVGHDVAGNPASQSCSYNVGYKLIAFLQPWAPPGSLAFKRGSTIPLKWQYANYYGTPVNTGAMSPLPKVGIAGGCGSVPSSTDVIAVDSPGASGLTYDPATYTWHYNWQTKGVAGSCFWLGVQTDATKQLDLYGWSSTLGTLPLQVQLR